VYRKFVAKRGPVSFGGPPMELMLESEQAPDPSSRVMLSADRDSFGMRKAVLDWRLNDLDKRTCAAVLEAMANEIGRQGWGRVKVSEWLLSNETAWPKDLEGGHHHMGTTRMADDPKRGVVDRDCKVHGISNLYILGSSVFATGGYANPSFTIIALALRLADHLRRTL
jgi:choline dehydrogenase-like flavoprotein